MSSEDPQMWYGDARNYYWSSRRAHWYDDFDLEAAFWAVCGVAFACLATFGLLFVWYNAVWNIFLGIPTPQGGAEVNTVEIFAFVTTVILLFAIVTAVCVTTYRIKRTALEYDYRTKRSVQDYELQLKTLAATQPALPPTSPEPSVSSIVEQIAQVIRLRHTARGNKSSRN